MANKHEIVAVVPVREGSSRVKGKNFIPFSNNQSLLEIKLEQLLSADCFDKVYVSSDSDKARKIATTKGVDFLLRESRLCQGEVPFAELVEYIANSVPGENPMIAYVLATSPLFDDFRLAVKTFLQLKDKHDSLVAVLPRKAFFLNKQGRGINYHHGYWHEYSQDLETYYEVTGACYIASKQDMLKWKYWFGVRPYLFEVPSITAVDVDTPEDFRFAQKLFELLKDQ